MNMSTWHRCETTHCRAGWAVRLAGPAGQLLESQQDTAAAAALIIAISCPWLEKVPNFYDTDENAMADIRVCAEIEKEMEGEQ